MDKRYDILNNIRNIEKKHSKIKQIILNKINEYENIIKQIDYYKKELEKIEENYILLIEKFIELNNKN